MEITLIEDQAVWFAPDVQDNRAKPEEARFAVKLRPLTKQEVSRVQAPVVTRLQEEIHEQQLSALQAYERGLECKRNAALEAAVLEVANLKVRHVKGGEVTHEQVTTVKRLLEVAGDALLDQIYQALDNHSRLEQGLLGKLSSAPASSVAPTARSGAGGAATAEAQATPSRTGSASSDAAPEAPTIPTSTSTSRPTSNAALGAS